MAYKQRWTQYFEVLDANNNGTIELGDIDAGVKLAEASGHFKGPEVAKLKEALRRSIEGIIKSSDANKDGKVTRQEFLSSVEKNFAGKANFQALPDWYKQAVDEAFQAADANKNGEITEEELVKAVTTLDPSTTPEAVKDAYNHVKGPGKFDLAAYQTLAYKWAASPNAEPYVVTLTPALRKPSAWSSGYLQRWLQYFEVLDANNSGTIDHGDVDAGVKLAEKAGLNAAALAVVKSALTKVVEGIIKSADANKDNKVTREEFVNSIKKNFGGKSNFDALPEWWKQSITELFHAIDTNKNGDLSEEEVVKSVTHADPTTTAEQVKKAYAHEKGAGKFDLAAYQRLAVKWATSPNPEHDVVILTPSLRKH